ncbi:MAG: hypothetical protein AB7G12_02665 [Thermoanaerobaculia bacterium]
MQSAAAWRRFAIAAMFVVSALFPQPARPLDGELDPLFPRLVLPLPPLVTGSTQGVRIRIQQDGRILVLAEFTPPGSIDPKALLIYRLLPDGQPDTGFADDGLYILEINGRPIHPTALELDSAGRIVFGGWGEQVAGQNSWLIGRLLPGGEFDPDFANGYPRTVTFGAISGGVDDRLNDLAISQDGGIAAGGVTTFSSARQDAAFCRLTSDGDFDSSFGLNGLTVANLGPVNADARATEATDLLLEPGSELLTFAGTHYSVFGTTYNSYWVAGRIGTNGVFDPSFHGTGYLLTSGSAIDPTTTDSWGTRIVRNSDGSYLQAGHFFQATIPYSWIALAKILENGTVSILWGDFGYRSFVYDAAAGSQVAGFALDGEERPLIAGWADFGGTYPKTGYARFAGDLPDPNFVGGGATSIDLVVGPMIRGLGNDIAVDRGGRFLILGTTIFNHATPDAYRRATIVRFRNGLPFADDFESGSTYRWYPVNP